MPRPVLVGAVAALALLVASGCTHTDPSGGSTPAPTSTVRVGAPESKTPSGTPMPTATAGGEHGAGDGHGPEHGPVVPDATGEPTDAAYLAVRTASAAFVEAFYDFGYPDGYARDYLDRSQPYMTERFFYEQLTLVEDSGANSDPAWQQLTRDRRRSTVEVGTVIPGYVDDDKAFSRVEVRIAIVAAGSDGRTEGVPDAAARQYALLTFAKVAGDWLVDDAELVRP